MSSSESIPPHLSQNTYDRQWIIHKEALGTISIYRLSLTIIMVFNMIHVGLRTNRKIKRDYS